MAPKNKKGSKKTVRDDDEYWSVSLPLASFQVLERARLKLVWLV